MEWYREVKQSVEATYLDSEAECTDEKRVIEETTYKVVRYISDSTTGKPIKEYTDHMTTDEVKELSYEIYTNKQAYLKAVLDQNFAKQECWICFSHVFPDNRPAFKVETRATALNKTQLDKWSTYFKENKTLMCKNQYREDI